MENEFEDHEKEPEHQQYNTETDGDADDFSNTVKKDIAVQACLLI